MRIFVGYGKDAAQRVAKQLWDFLKDQTRWEIFKAPEDVPMGSWPQLVLDALESADVLIVVYARGSWRSQNLMHEISFALAWDLEVLPLVERRINVNNWKFPEILRTKQITAYDTPNPALAFDDIMTKLKQHAVSLPYGGLELAEAVRA